jgi:hypothetical protein
MSSEGWLPRDKLLDGGLFDALESLMSQGSDWELRDLREPNAHNDTGASVHQGGAAGDAPRVPRVRARGASPSLANVLALDERAAHPAQTRARAPRPLARGTPALRRAVLDAPPPRWERGAGACALRAAR